MSPYLFVLCIDKLSHMILDSIDDNQWDCLKIGRGPKISHMMFADDLIIFGAVTERKISLMLQILHNLCQMSRQRMSMEKSNFTFSRNTNRPIRRLILSKAGSYIICVGFQQIFIYFLFLLSNLK